MTHMHCAFPPNEIDTHALCTHTHTTSLHPINCISLPVHTMAITVAVTTQSTNYSLSHMLLQKVMYEYIPFRAMTLDAGFMMAESAVMGRRMGLAESLRSMMITWDVSPTFSLTQMNLSDSIVRVAKPICWTLMPTFWSWNERRGG